MKLNLIIKREKKGFTLIELLIVIAIIGLLTGLIVANVRAAKQKTREVTRISDIKTLRNSLALYQSNKGAYPIYDGYITGSDALSIALQNELILLMIPLDPLNEVVGGLTYKYSYQSIDGVTYALKFCLETNYIQNYNQGCDNTVSP